MNKIESINDIKSGYLIRTRNGKIFICMRFKQECFIKTFTNEKGECLNITCFNKKLQNNCDHQFDIMKIYGLAKSAQQTLSFDTNGRPLLWEREETKKMTIGQIQDALGYKIEIVEG